MCGGVAGGVCTYKRLVGVCRQRVMVRERRGRKYGRVVGLVAEGGELEAVKDLLHLCSAAPRLQLLGVLVGVLAHLAVEMAAGVRRERACSHKIIIVFSGVPSEGSLRPCKQRLASLSETSPEIYLRCGGACVYSPTGTEVSCASSASVMSTPGSEPGVGTLVGALGMAVAAVAVSTAAAARRSIVLNPAKVQGGVPRLLLFLA